MSREMMKSRLGNLRLYKIDVPYESNVGVIVLSYGGGGHEGQRFQLSRYTGQRRGRHSKAGLSKSFVDLVKDFFYMRNDSNIANQIFDYIVSNFSFKDVEIVPPACPVLVFHFQPINFAQDHVPEIDITVLTRAVLVILRTRNSVLSVEDAITRLIPIVPPTTKIVDCYQSSELCRLCGKGYPKENEIVHKTKCNHIFHGNCISRYLLHTPHCPVCFVHLSPVDIRIILFS